MLNRERIVFFNGFIDGENLSRLTGPIEKHLCALASTDPHSPAVLCITSPGGHLASSFDFFARMIYFGNQNIHTIALDDTSSAALFLYIAGKKRFTTPHTMFFIHKIQTHIDDYCGNIAGASNKTFENIMTLMTEKGTELTASDALKIGIAHEMLSLEDERRLRAWRDTPES